MASSGYSNIADATTQVGIVFMTTPLLDDFEREGYGAPLNYEWTNVSNLYVYGGECSSYYEGSIGGATWPDIFTESQEFYMKLRWDPEAVGQGAQVWMRINGLGGLEDGIGFMFALDPSYHMTIRNIETDEIVVMADAVSGDIFGAILVGENIYIQHNGNLISTQQQSAHMGAGKLAISVSSSGVGFSIDDFGGGSLES